MSLKVVKPEGFDFTRRRGIVWVCDIVGSSNHLNDDKTVDEFEKFLPRFYWTAEALVLATGGVFVKRTGDGFLAWFECELERHATPKAREVMSSCWHLSTIINVTQLGVECSKKIRIQHGITYEPDGLVIRSTHPVRGEDIDIIGRSVVLAFRLAGIPSKHPCIASTHDLVSSLGNPLGSIAYFKKKVFNRDDRLKYFKGERLDRGGVYISDKEPPRKRSLKSVVSSTKAALKAAEVGDDPPSRVAVEFVSAMMNGGAWAKGVVQDYNAFMSNQVMGVLKEFIEKVERKRD